MLRGCPAYHAVSPGWCWAPGMEPRLGGVTSLIPGKNFFFCFFCWFLFVLFCCLFWFFFCFCCFCLFFDVVLFFFCFLCFIQFAFVFFYSGLYGKVAENHPIATLSASLSSLHGEVFSKAPHFNISKVHFWR